MKEVISEILQRKEQQEEDRYFETLNRDVAAKTGRRRGARDRRDSSRAAPAAGQGMRTPGQRP